MIYITNERSYNSDIYELVREKAFIIKKRNIVFVRNYDLILFIDFRHILWYICFQYDRNDIK